MISIQQFRPPNFSAAQLHSSMGPHYLNSNFSLNLGETSNFRMSMTHVLTFERERSHSVFVLIEAVAEQLNILEVNILY